MAQLAKCCFDIADPSVCQDLTQTFTQRSGWQTCLTTSASRQQRKPEPRQMSSDGLCVLVEKESISATLRSTRSRNPLLVFSIFQMISVYVIGTFVVIMLNCTRVTQRRIRVTEKKKMALALISRYLSPKVKTTTAQKRKACLLLSCLLKSLQSLITTQSYLVS